jgi:integrase
MRQTFEKVEPGIYLRQYVKVTGERSVLYYGRLKNKKTGKRELFHLGPSLQDARNDWAIIRARNRKGEDLSEYKAQPKPQAENKPSTGVLTFAKWAELYPLIEEVGKKRSLSSDLGMIRLHLLPFFGETPVAGFKRKMLLEYIRSRQKDTLVRSGKASNHAVKRGTISNELSLLRSMLRLAAQENDDLDITVPSFDGLIVRVKRGGRALSAVEQGKVNLVYPVWLRRLAEFCKETCMSEGDALRLTLDMVDFDAGVVIPEGGRLKTQATTDSEAEFQVCPLTDRAREVLDEIAADRRARKIAVNADKLIFTRDDGRRIGRDMISRAVKRACEKTSVKKFVFHNYRNTALTE